jgi:hypothetical protein
LISADGVHTWILLIRPYIVAPAPWADLNLNLAGGDHRDRCRQKLAATLFHARANDNTMGERRS